MAKPNALEIALTAFQVRVARLRAPALPAIVATASDEEAIAVHLATALQPALDYATAVIAAVHEVTPGGVADETGGLHDAVKDVVGAILRAGCAIRTDEQEARAEQRYDNRRGLRAYKGEAA